MLRLPVTSKSRQVPAWMSWFGPFASGGRFNSAKQASPVDTRANRPKRVPSRSASYRPFRLQLRPQVLLERFHGRFGHEFAELGLVPLLRQSDGVRRRDESDSRVGQQRIHRRKAISNEHIRGTCGGCLGQRRTCPGIGRREPSWNHQTENDDKPKRRPQTWHGRTPSPEKLGGFHGSLVEHTGRPWNIKVYRP